MKRAAWVALPVALWLAFVILRSGSDRSPRVEPPGPGMARETPGKSGPAPVASVPSRPAAPPAVQSAPAPDRVSSLPPITGGKTAGRPASPSSPSSPPAAAISSGAEIEMEEVHTTIRDFGLQFDGNPVGTNAEITGALAGNNPKQTDFLTGRDLRRNGAGELVDPWGTPYFFHQMSGEVMEVRSAGPDRVMWTKDDLSM